MGKQERPQEFPNSVKVGHEPKFARRGRYASEEENGEDMVFLIVGSHIA
jgi:hypothetical protein